MAELDDFLEAIRNPQGYRPGEFARGIQIIDAHIAADPDTHDTHDTQGFGGSAPAI